MFVYFCILFRCRRNTERVKMIYDLLCAIILFSKILTTKLHNIFVLQVFINAKVFEYVFTGTSYIDHFQLANDTQRGTLGGNWWPECQTWFIMGVSNQLNWQGNSTSAHTLPMTFILLWHIDLPATWLFVQLLFQTLKKPPKLCITFPLWGYITVD